MPKRKHTAEEIINKLLGNVPNREERAPSQASRHPPTPSTAGKPETATTSAVEAAKLAG